MKIKKNSKEYNQLKYHLENGQVIKGQTKVGVNESKVRYVWDMLWASLLSSSVRIVYYPHNYHNEDKEIRLPENCNDDHISTALLHILHNQNST